MPATWTQSPERTAALKPMRSAKLDSEGWRSIGSLIPRMLRVGLPFLLSPGGGLPEAPGLAGSGQGLLALLERFSLRLERLGAVLLPGLLGLLALLLGTLRSGLLALLRGLLRVGLFALALFAGLLALALRVGLGLLALALSLGLGALRALVSALGPLRCGLAAVERAATLRAGLAQ